MKSEASNVQYKVTTTPFNDRSSLTRRVGVESSSLTRRVGDRPLLKDRIVAAEGLLAEDTGIIEALMPI